MRDTTTVASVPHADARVIIAKRLLWPLEAASDLSKVKYKWEAQGGDGFILYFFT